MTTTLVLGGARSGKSRHAQALTEAAPGSLAFIATAEPFDAEMAERIALHRADRGERWTTFEAPLDLVGAIEAASGHGGILVDCLTLWLSNLMHHRRDLEAETQRLCAAIAGSPCPLVLVANEVGLGIVPDNALARAFRDAAGRLNQSVGEAVDRAVFVAAGLPLVLK